MIDYGSIYGSKTRVFGYLKRGLVGLIQLIPVDAATMCFATTVCVDQQLSHLIRRLVLVTCVDVPARCAQPGRRVDEQTQ